MVEPIQKPAQGEPGWRQELAALWESLPHKPLFFGLLGAWCVLFHFLGNATLGYVETRSLFGWMNNAYNVKLSEDQHGNLIPFVVLGLLWWKRRQLTLVEKGIWWPALAGLGAAAAMHLAGYVAQQPRISIAGFFLGVYALTGLAWGPAWLRASAFPFFLFVFAIPVGSLAERITFPMRLASTWMATQISQAGLGIDVIRDGTRIFDPQGLYQYDVAPACSGIRSLISLVALGTIYAFVSFRTFWKRVVAMLLAFPLALAGNVVRLLGVILTAEAVGQEAGMKVHDYAGFVTFLLALGVLMLVGYWMGEEKVLEEREAAA
ncbi:MAG TPA: exosortase/archaeosortase family protein [Candidatus Paceibacterota bacterium]|nr:exosortase/archaeosortase family protein [Verrucomicrobiota bacterium]HRZ47002.1 exosortase/archaeosortase family protein [Candidatus Paceibacterota bacterium]